MSHLSPEHVQHLYDTFGELKVLDDIVRHRVAPVPVLGYQDLDIACKTMSSLPGYGWINSSTPQ